MSLPTEEENSAAGDMAPPAVPGYVPLGLIGRGASGSVWLALDRATGEQVALKVVPDSAAVGSVMREVALLRRVDHPHVVRARAAIEQPDGSLVVVLDHAAGGSLAAQVACRGALEAGEVVTLVTPLASTLADLHSRGLVHGDLSPGNVLLTANGRPLLSDLGLATVLGEGRPASAGTPGFVPPELLGGGVPGPEADVYGLAATGWFALTGQPPPRAADRPPLGTLAPGIPTKLATLIDQALADAPEARPAPAQLAVDCWASADPVPIRLSPAAAGPRADLAITHRLRAQAAQARPAAAAPGRRRGQASAWGRRRRLALLGGTALAVLATGLALLLGSGQTRQSTPGDRQPQRAAATQEAASEALTRVVAGLAANRAAAFAAADEALLDSVDAPGSAALKADAVALQALRDSGVRYEGLTFAVLNVRLLRSDASTSVVAVAVATGPYRERSADGAVREVAGQPPRSSVLTLVRHDGQWRVSSVS